MVFSRIAKFRISISLALSLIFLGWTLTAYQISVWGWIGTFICLQHLAKNGRGAIPVALAWATAMIGIGAFYYSAPVGFLWRNASYWATSLIFLWSMATSIILTVAKIPTVFYNQEKLRSPTWVTASMLMGSCLGLGIGCYRLGLALRS